MGQRPHHGQRDAGHLRNLRTQLFTHMESLPIKYFDQHPHGDIMSVYTNDVDTLRQMLSQSIPQLVSSAITIVSVFFSMCMLSWQLTIVTMLMVALMMFCSKKSPSSPQILHPAAAGSGQVERLHRRNDGGQKVVKVFTHEQKALAGFRQLNDQLKDSANKANSFANIMMPVNAQLATSAMPSARWQRSHGRERHGRHDPWHGGGFPEPE